MRTIGWESRKLRRPVTVARIIASSNLSITSVRLQYDSSALTRNTNVKGRTSFILRNVSNNPTSEDKPTIPSSSRTVTSSEKTGDVMVENTSMAIS